MTTQKLHEIINLGEDVDVVFKSAKTSKDYIIFDIGGQARGQAKLQGGQVEFEGAKLITNLTQTSVSPYLSGLSHKIYKRGPSLPISSNKKYRLTELGEKTLAEKNKI